MLRRASPTYPMPSAVRRRAMALTTDAAFVRDLTGPDRRAPDHVALRILLSAALELLRSGRYHIYRGVLNGEGHALESMFTRCTTELERRGYQTDRDAQLALRALRDEIGGTGFQG